MPCSKEYQSLSEAQLAQLGRALSDALFPGAFIALFGDLGAGKTTLTRAIGQGLGIQDIQSPTFTIVREHRDGRLPLFHFDAYRLGSGEELYAIGYGDYLAQQGVVVMEWCENVPEALPAQRLEIHLAGSGMEPRQALLRATDPAHCKLLEALP